MQDSILLFDQAIAKQKPNSIHRNSPCPFCRPEELARILEVRGSMMLVENKYPVLQDAYQTVLIETDECQSELSEYPPPHLYQLIRFGVEKWMEMENNAAFRSALFFKNHGPLSGGSIRHPHMQIIGLKTIDYRENLRDEYFEGETIHRENGVAFNVSTRPMIGMTEFNVILEDLEAIDRAARLIQIAAHYTLHHYHGGTSSYNLFFYRWSETIIAKIVPRFATSPLYVGYKLRQVSNHVPLIKTEIQNLYLKME